MTSYASHLHEETLLILLFHGVIPRQQHPVRNYTAKHMERDSFVRILRELKEAGGTPVSMQQMVDLRAAGKPWPRRSFAVTFDDGFENNHSVAAPVLSELNIPATFYVTTKFVDEGACSWIDEIEYAVERKTPCRLNLPSIKIDGSFASPSEKIGLLTKIRERVKLNPKLDPYALAREIWSQVNVVKMDPDHDLDDKMSWRQVQELQDNSLFTVGGHGHTHRILSYLSVSELTKEIDESFRLLKTHLRQPITHYSYPEGLKFCYSSHVIAELKQRGIQCCPSAEDGVNGPSESLFDLKRVMVR